MNRQAHINPYGARARKPRQVAERRLTRLQAELLRGGRLQVAAGMCFILAAGSEDARIIAAAEPTSGESKRDGSIHEASLKRGGILSSA